MNALENNKLTKENRYLFSAFFSLDDGSRHYSVDRSTSFFYFSIRRRVVIKDKYNTKRSTSLGSRLASAFVFLNGLLLIDCHPLLS